MENNLILIKEIPYADLKIKSSMILTRRMIKRTSGIDAVELHNTYIYNKKTMKISFSIN